MRKTYDLDGLIHPNESLAKDIAYSRYLELARNSEPLQTKVMGTQTVATLLVEPNTLLREGLKRILAETAYNPVVLSSQFDGALAEWEPDNRPCLFIMDAARDHDETCRQLKQLKERHASIRVVLLVDQYDLKRVFAAFQAGADAYLMKSISCEVLVKSLDLVMLGEPVYPSAILDLLSNHVVPNGEDEGANELQKTDEEQPPAKGLSVRETVILRCLMEGDSNKLIARKFDITEATVKVHVKAILRKIRAKNRTQAAIWAASNLPAEGHASAG